MGVGRPALSNLVNGKSSLSPDMAVRLEKAFGADRQQLLNRQADFDRYSRIEKDRFITSHVYIPDLQPIKAQHIQKWAESNIEVRNLLPVLLRKLVHSTGHELQQVDFPGYDNAERKGWDGLTEAAAATPWVPEGKSCWEFSTNKNPRNKAEKVYADRLFSVSADERAECSFIFVTPHNWPRKNEWANSKQATGNWKAVRAFDASDLEQWVEESIPAQMWLAEQLDMQIKGFETLDRCWQRWEEASDPKMVPTLFEPALMAHSNTFKKWLQNPNKEPFVVEADSKDEALAFLWCLFQDSDIATGSKAIPAVFKSAETLRTVATPSSRLIPIVCSEEAERELANVYRRLPSIGIRLRNDIRPRNDIDSQSCIALDLPKYDAFEKALAEMGIKGDRVELLARESGCSPTILRRRLSRIPAIMTPQWAGDSVTASDLLPMALIGAWNATSKADREILASLAEKPYQDIEKSIARLLQVDDSPVWSVGHYRGVASRIDALFVVDKHVIEEDLDKFFRLVERVLSESEPALDLPEDQRWAAPIYDKVRAHSNALREGICETLVLLSVHGNNLFQSRIGIDVESRVSILIHKLLAPLTLDKLLSHNKDLPRYAEAAPDVFLKLLETDLRQSSPVVLGLLQPTESGPFASPIRAELLWALECLAWQDLNRVSLILAQLSETIIDDNWTNKPISSLQAMYRSWMPQTATSLEERMKGLETLTKKRPVIGWQICIEQLKTGTRFGNYSYRPRWRSDASGAGQPVTWGEFHQFTRKALDLVFAWPKHDPRTLGDLIERVKDIAEQDQAKVWDLIDAWADSEADDKAKAELRERIRRFAFTRSGRLRGLNDATKNRARLAYKKLQPRDLVVRHAWLFAQHWVEPSTDKIEDQNFDYDKHGEETQKLRTGAMREIWTERGFDGVTDLLSHSNAPDRVGNSLGMSMTDANIQADILRQCLSISDDLEKKFDFCIHGFLSALKDDAQSAILAAVADGMDTNRIVRLFLQAPFGQATWRLIDQYGEKIFIRYWREVVPYWKSHSEADLNEIIDRLLEAKRPRAAFHVVRLDWHQIETSRLKRLLLKVATVDAEPAEWYRVDDYDISAALNSLDGRTGVRPDEMAQLEFLYIEALEHSEHGIPNLERQIADSPIFFVQLLALAFKRNDDGQDPPEWRIEDREHRKGLISAAYQLLGRIQHVPGSDHDGKIKTEALHAWVTEVRRLCAEHGRGEIGDEKIGELLSKAPTEENGEWPCLPVCEVMERIASQEIGTGFNIGVYNNRGVHFREEGGAQERALAAQYRDWAKLREFDYPYVSSVLKSIADGYDRDAQRWDTEAKIEKRLRH